jgi:cobalt transporter subunit CbtB
MNPQQTLQTTLPALPATASHGVLRQLAAGALLGVVMLYGVAFAESPLAHNAAHDVRHATGRPCH